MGINEIFKTAGRTYSAALLKNMQHSEQTENRRQNNWESTAERLVRCPETKEQHNLDIVCTVHLVPFIIFVQQMRNIFINNYLFLQHCNMFRCLHIILRQFMFTKVTN